MSDYREVHEQARAAGVARRNETRHERAIRRAVADEIADKLETMALNEDLPQEWPHVLSWAARFVREIGAQS